MCTPRAFPAPAARLTRLTMRIRLGHAGLIAPGRNRTCDLALRRRALYPLSYRRWRGNVVYPRGARAPGSSTPRAAPRRSRSRAARRTRPRSSRSRSGTATSPGFGEAAPIERYDESAESALAYLEGVAGELGDDPVRARGDARGGCRAGQYAARAAIDAALHDLCGKLAGEPVWRLLGLERLGPPTSWTIWLGDPDDMARRPSRAPRAAASSG